MTQASAPLLPLLLQRIGEELSAQADQVRDLHALVDTDGAGTETLVKAQTIDTSSQHLAELGALLCCIAASASPSAVPPSCFEAMTLSGLKARLFGETEETAEAGEVDFF